MTDYNLILYVAITLVGIVWGSYSGYKEAKKADPATTFEIQCFIESLLRALPGIVAAVGSLAVLGITLEGALTAFFAGVGSDVVLKRAWRSVRG